MPTYRLHYFPESGNSYKLALMLTLCGERFEPVWTDFGGGITRTTAWQRRSTRWVKFLCWRWTAGAAADRADPACSSPDNTARFRRRDRAGTVRTAALAFLGQSQADRLYGDLSLLPYLHAGAGPARAEPFSPPARRFPRDPRSAPAEERVCDRRTTDDLGYFHDGLFTIRPTRPGTIWRQAIPRSALGSGVWHNCRAGNRPMSCLPGQRLTHYAR